MKTCLVSLSPNSPVSLLRYFRGEVIEAIVNEQWCDCKILRVVPPTEEEVKKDADEEAAAAAADGGDGGEGSSPGKSGKPKEKKSFSPPDHLFKYEVQEVEPDDPLKNDVSCLV